MATVLVILGMLGLVALAILWRGLVLSIMWAWFMVPLGLPEIGIALAIGVAATVGMVTNSSAASSGKEGETGQKFALIFLTPLFVLGIGWAVHQFI